MARSKDIGSYIIPKAGPVPAAAAAGTVNGAAIPTKGAGSLVLYHACGATTGGPTSFTVATKLMSSPDGSSSWDDIPGAPAPAVLTAENTNARVTVELNRLTTEPFVRVVVTVAFVGGTTPTVACAALAILGGQRAMPAS